MTVLKLLLLVHDGAEAALLMRLVLKLLQLRQADDEDNKVEVSGSSH